MKTDIESEEKISLGLGSRELRPCIIEAHRFTAMRSLEKPQNRFGMRKILPNGKSAVVLTNVVSGDQCPF